MSGKHIRTVAVISQVWRGHVPAYHNHYVRAFARAGLRVVEITPERGWDAPQSNRYDLRRMICSVLARIGLWPALDSLRHWSWAGRRIRAEERRLGTHIDAVFLTYLDLAFVSRGIPGWIVDSLIARPWAGVRLHPWVAYGRSPRAFPAEEGVFASKYCRALVVVDASFVSVGISCWPGKIVVMAPEIADVAQPDESQPTAVMLRAWAGSRKVVGLLGVISAKKNVTAFISMARQAERAGDDIVFVLAGDLIRQGADAAAPLGGEPFPDLPANCRAWVKPVREGAEFNAMVAACDALFLAYRPAPEKSNVLTKAAYFNRPVVVSEGHLMADAVRTFNLGLVVPSGDAPAALSAVRQIFIKAEARDYEGFYRLNATERLDEVVSQVVDSFSV